MNSIHKEQVTSIEAIQKALEQANYICGKQIATAIYLSYHLKKPILVEGPPGVGKTELAKATSRILRLSLTRLQCYEGLDESKALYEWKYGKQLLYIQILRDQLGNMFKGVHNLEESVKRLNEFGDIFYSEDFLEPRPLLKALREPEGTVLLIDEIDKSDHEFEAFLLEMLSDYQVSIPEIGTVKSLSIPIVILTSNNTRELSEPLKRRCLHLYIPFPDMDLERRIIQAQIPEIAETLKNQLVAFVQKIRTLNLNKRPSVSETIDWARALILLHAQSIDMVLVQDTLNVLLKKEEDIQTVKSNLDQLLELETGGQ